MSVTKSDNIVPALAIAASLDLSPAAQTKCTSKPGSVQVSNVLLVFVNFPGPSLASENQSLSMLLKETKKKPAEWKEEYENVLLHNIRLLQDKNRSLAQKGTT